MAYKPTDGGPGAAGPCTCQSWAQAARGSPDPLNVLICSSCCEVELEWNWKGPELARAGDVQNWNMHLYPYPYVCSNMRQICKDVQYAKMCKMISNRMQVYAQNMQIYAQTMQGNM